MTIKIKIIFAVAITTSLTLILLLVIKSSLKQKSYHPPEPKSNEVIRKIDKNKDGKTDNWVYETKEGIPMRWIRDDDFDGIPESWSFFKNGKAFIDEEDFDKDGKIDALYFHIFNEDGKYRGFSFVLSDKKRNIFAPHEDTGWVAMKGKDNILKTNDK